jgi:hypothetical protein
MPGISRNQPCPCGSGKKYKKCCYDKNDKGKIIFSCGLKKDLAEGATMTSGTQKKMSEILLEFAKPLTDVCKSDRAFCSAIELSAIAWNSSFFPRKKMNKLTEESIEKYIEDNQDKEMIKEMLSMMIERKKKSFSLIKTMILNFEITYKNGEHKINVMSAPIKK